MDPAYISPFQGSRLIPSPYPGRCPGLACSAPSGQGKTRRAEKWRCPASNAHETTPGTSEGWGEGPNRKRGSCLVSVPSGRGGPASTHFTRPREGPASDQARSGQPHFTRPRAGGADAVAAGWATHAPKPTNLATPIRTPTLAGKLPTSPPPTTPTYSRKSDSNKEARYLIIRNCRSKSLRVP